MTQFDNQPDRADEIDKLLKRPEVQRDLHKDEDE